MHLSYTFMSWNKQLSLESDLLMSIISVLFTKSIIAFASFLPGSVCNNCVDLNLYSGFILLLLVKDYGLLFLSLIFVIVTTLQLYVNVLITHVGGISANKGRVNQTDLPVSFMQAFGNRQTKRPSTEKMKRTTSIALCLSTEETVC